MFTKVVRAILILALIYGAYRETGFFTALSLLIIFVAIEVQSWLTKRAADLPKPPRCPECWSPEGYSHNPGCSANSANR